MHQAIDDHELPQIHYDVCGLSAVSGRDQIHILGVPSMVSFLGGTVGGST